MPNVAYWPEARTTNDRPNDACEVYARSFCPHAGPEALRIGEKEQNEVFPFSAVVFGRCLIEREVRQHAPLLSSRLAACWSSSQMSLAQFGHAQMRTNFPVRRSRTQARKDTGTLQSSHTGRGGDCSCLSFIRSKPVANGVRLCWFFVPDELSAFASKKPND